MSDRNKLIVLLVLVGVFIAVNLRGYFAPAAPAVSGRPQARGKASERIPDADLDLKSLETAGLSDPSEAKRNIFQYGHAAQPVSQRRAPTPEPVEVVPPPPPPKPPVRFFGFAQGSAGGARRVFLTNGEDTFIAREGEVFMQRYRLLRIGKDTVEIEETSGAHRWVVPLEQP
ncbi:MAG: hypothetical protein L0212_12315 [Acidobacteria bacterium]|nr:hypothetical protein [Acidobacteriota bacterium]